LHGWYQRSRSVPGILEASNRECFHLLLLTLVQFTWSCLSTSRMLLECWKHQDKPKFDGLLGGNGECHIWAAPPGCTSCDMACKPGQRLDHHSDHWVLQLTWYWIFGKSPVITRFCSFNVALLTYDALRCDCLLRLDMVEHGHLCRSAMEYRGDLPGVSRPSFST
jgi:hypothetical protein